MSEIMTAKGIVPPAWTVPMYRWWAKHTVAKVPNPPNLCHYFWVPVRALALWLWLHWVTPVAAGVVSIVAGVMAWRYIVTAGGDAFALTFAALVALFLVALALAYSFDVHRRGNELRNESLDFARSAVTFGTFLCIVALPFVAVLAVMFGLAWAVETWKKHRTRTRRYGQAKPNAIRHNVAMVVEMVAAKKRRICPIIALPDETESTTNKALTH